MVMPRHSGSQMEQLGLTGSGEFPLLVLKVMCTSSSGRHSKYTMEDKTK